MLPSRSSRFLIMLVVRSDCEYEFSAFTEKNKKRKKLFGIDDEMRVCLIMT